MIDHLIFIFYIFFFLLSTIGYGLKFSFLINHNLRYLTLGWYGLIGFFIISFISLITSFFTSHNYLHNIILHIFGFILFFKLIKERKNSYELRILFILLLLLIIGAYVFKNHDDFPYYHLTYALNLSENSFIVGTGNFNHGFRTFSSLFYYHSTLYMPYVKFYLFHIGPFYILIFFNLIIIERLLKNLKLNKIDFSFFFSLLSLIFVNIVFYRISEHGTDRSAQILLLLIILLFIEIYFFEKQKEIINKKIFLLILIVVLAASMKAIYYLYLILVPLIVFKKNLIKIFIQKKNLFFSIMIVFFISLNLLIYYLNTGCFLYPAEISCIFKNAWSIPKDEVRLMSIHYEWWAKAGGGPDYASKIEKSEYIKNFIWLGNWIERYFFNKISDTLLGIIFICLTVVLSFRFFKTNKRKANKINFVVYFLLFIFLLEWFLKHPAMRYGGYVLVGLPLIVYASSLLSKFSYPKKDVYKLTIFFILISFTLYDVRNIFRINKEMNVYGYNILKSPFFYIQKVETKIIAKDVDIKINKPLNRYCWASKTPCSNDDNLKIGNFLWMKMISRK